MNFKTLQTTFAPNFDFPPDLYLRLHNAEGQDIAVSAPSESGGIDQTLNPGDLFSTNTYFGSFYWSYWRKHTNVSDVSIGLTLKGHAEIQVFEDTGESLRIIQRTVTDSATMKKHFINCLAAHEEEGRLCTHLGSRIYVEIRALSPCRITGLDFASHTAAERKVSLSVGLCTFNQEKYFTRTLKTLVDYALRNEWIHEIYVINQGNDFESNEIEQLLNEKNIVYIKQKNLGGCGGFTRTLIEAQNTKRPTTHHLLMDDDIILDPRMISRAMQFSGYVKSEIVIGAGMLDALRPTVMHEAGAFLKRDNSIEPYCHNVDVADPRHTGFFSKYMKIDYNAWWFCILPLKESNKIGLPAPIFIRGDDFEYGQRLARHGVPTLSLPGIAVWHEPFYAKPSGWQAYYDLRNRLIFGAIYPEKVRQISLVHILGLATNASLTHNYMLADLRMKAVEDFLRGPDALFARNSDEIHAEIMALAKSNAPETMPATEGIKKQPTDRTAKPMPILGLYALILAQTLSLLRSGFGPHLKRSPKIILDVHVNIRNTSGRAYIMTNGPRSYHLLFQPRRSLVWRQFLTALRLGWRYWREKETAGEIWRRDIVKYRQSEWWNPILGRD